MTPLRAALAAVVLLAGCGNGDGESGTPAARPTALDRGVAAIRDCRVRSVLATHAGALVLELDDGTGIELSDADRARVDAAIAAARPRCGDVLVATE